MASYFDEDSGTPGDKVSAAHFDAMAVLHNHSDYLNCRGQYPCYSIESIDWDTRLEGIYYEFANIAHRLRLRPHQLGMWGGILVSDPERKVQLVCCIHNFQTQEVLDKDIAAEFCRLMKIEDEVVMFEVPKKHQLD